MAHDCPGVVRNPEMDGPDRTGRLADLQSVAGYIGKASGIGTPSLGGNGEGGGQPLALPSGQSLLKVQNTK